MLENFSPGTADRLGIGYREVKARNPDIVYASVSSYGQFGPWKNGRGWERQGQAVAGIMERQEPPAILGPYNLIDIGTGVLATFATGSACTTGCEPARASTSRARCARRRPITRRRTCCRTPVARRRTSRAATWRSAPVRSTASIRAPTASGSSCRCRTPTPASSQHVDGLTTDNLEARFKQEPANVWVQRLQQHGIPAQMRVPVDELMVDPYVVKRGLSVSQQVEGVGETTAPGLPVRLSRTPMRLGVVTGRPGSDAPDILTELGLQEELPKLEKAWVLQVNDLPSAW